MILMTLLSVVKIAAHTGVKRKLIVDTIILKIPVRTMSVDWKTEKQKYMSMDLEEKRKFLNASDRRYQTVENVPTWEEYHKRNSPLPKAMDIAGNFKINDSLNKELAKKVSMFAGDITTLEVDAIVNAANSSLLGGGGVDGAIHRCAGPELKAECATLKGCSTGQAKITGGYKLPAKYVIHTVGPQNKEESLLISCYKNCLEFMISNQIRTIAFPCIATGIYGYPIEKAVHVSNKQVREFLEKNKDHIDRVIFCLFGKDDVDIYERAMQAYFPIE